MQDVIVIGAGFAGLAAATALEVQGRSVLVLEARDRIGGKVTSGPDELGRRVDLGGQWVCDDMPNVLELIDRHGLTLVAPQRRGRRIAHPVGDFDAIHGAFDEAIDEAHDQTSDESFGDVARRLPADVAVGVRASAQSTMCVDPDRYPAWHIADMFARAPMNVEELQYYVAETIHELALRMAAGLAEPVRTGVRVTAVERRGDRVIVTTSTAAALVGSGGDGGAGVDGAVETGGGAETDGGADDIVFEARHVVLAVPPQVVPDIAHTPALPADVVRSCRAFVAGQVRKVLVRYDRPFWNDLGLEGTVQFTDPTTLYLSATTNDEGAGLVAFVGGALSEHVRTLEASERKATLLALFADALGPEALQPISWVERDWVPDDLGAGGYQSVLVDPTARDAHDVLRRGLARVLFASTEISPSFPGYIEGAICAGRAAASAIASS
ncbi:MAG: flavin monoamine oxidase family protein [Acidimicrobiales bacterium]